MMSDNRIRIWPLIVCAILVVLFTCGPAINAHGAGVLSARDNDVSPERAAGEHYTARTRRECREILMEAAASVYYPGRYEVTVTGCGFSPSALVIAQMFPDIIDISNTVIGESERDGIKYTTAVIGFRYIVHGENCEHEWEKKILSVPSCTDAGRVRISCILCGYEREEVIAALGHTDEDPDNICDICGEDLAGKTSEEGFEWTLGDIQIRKIGDTYYSFKCVDEDYRAGEPDGRRLALFLCEAVIRSDRAGSVSGREPLKFGEDNNYKNSEINAFLEKNLDDPFDEAVTVSIGVNTAYTGKTADTAFENMSASDLSAVNIGIPQYMPAKMFLLSVGEAFRYRQYVYDVPGGEGTFERGYWLRSPVYEEDDDGEFRYGQYAYTVDLCAGCIRPQLVTDTTPGIRPAFCLPQE